MRTWILTGMLWMAMTGAVAADQQHVRAELIADAKTVKPGDEFTVGLRLKMTPKWHVYWLNPGDNGMATLFHVSAPEGWEVGPIQWPTPSKFFDGTFTTYGYEGDVLLMRTVKVPSDAAVGATTLRSKAEWLVCDKDACVAGEAQLRLNIAVGEKSEPTNRDLFERWRDRWPASGVDAPGRVMPVLGPGAAKIDGDATRLTFNLVWAEEATDVDWYPAATDQMLVEDLKVETTGKFTKITYKLTSLKPGGERVAEVPGVLVFTDADGVRRSRVWSGLGQPIRKVEP